MQINLNDPADFTLENVRKLIRSQDDSVDTQFRVTTDGFLLLSTSVGIDDLAGILFRLETNVAGNDYVGEDAANDGDWVQTVYDVIRKNYPNPTDTYIDSF